MKLAADRDLVARQYASDFSQVWETGLPCLVEDWRRHADLERAIVRCQLGLMAAYPDTLILRKAGPEAAQASAVRAAQALAAGWPDTVAGRHGFHELDGWLRAEGHRRNPGATADLVTACLFVALWQDTIPWRDCFPPFAGLDHA
jgi:triphosphoribosyl-dephospho-CoA synthase